MYINGRAHSALFFLSVQPFPVLLECSDAPRVDRWQRWALAVDNLAARSTHAILVIRFALAGLPAALPRSEPAQRLHSVQWSRRSQRCRLAAPRRQASLHFLSDAPVRSLDLTKEES